jgi:DNA modification methylase
MDLSSSPKNLDIEALNESTVSAYLCAQGCIDQVLDELIDTYSSNKEPIQVDFRKLVNWVPYSDSYTHYLHKYPAKLIKHIPIFFLGSKRLLKKPNRLVLDPFSGTGTVLLEAILHGHNAIGCDANPLARLIAKVKVTPLEPDYLRSQLPILIRRAKCFRKFQSKNVVNIDHWFPKHAQLNLSKLSRAIDEIKDVDIQNFFNATLSSIVKKCSYADPNLSVPVKIKPAKYRKEELRRKSEKLLDIIGSQDVLELFEKHALANIDRIKKLYDEGVNNTAKIIGYDARDIRNDIELNGRLQPKNSVDLIITSPPYAGAQKYVRSSSLNLGWLGFCEENTLRDFERKNIGREHYDMHEYKKKVYLELPLIDRMLEKIWNINPLRAHINGNYLLEMDASLKEMYRVLKKNAHCVLVIGNNEVCGMPFETQKYMKLMAERIGFKTVLILNDDIQSRGLMTKRNKTASVINSEWVLVFQK